MLTITKDINVVSVGQRPVINLSQYDSDFSLVFNLYASMGAFTMPSGTTAQIQGTKTDGNGYSAAASVSGNTVTVTGHVQMTAAAGPNVYEIAIFNNDKRLSTINFILMVERAALDSDTVSSESVIKDLSNIPEAVEQAEAAADRAEEAARTLTIDPTLTQSGQAADAKVTGDEINDLKEDLNFNEYSIAFAENDGFLSATGSVQPQTNGIERYTNLISASPNSQIEISLAWGDASANKWVAYALYDASQRFISRPVLINNVKVKGYKQVVTIPDGAYYIVFMYRTFNDVSTRIINSLSEKIKLIENELLSPNYIRGINHRGYNTIAPENTLPAFRLSKRMGFAVVETDICGTSDGVPVCLHDKAINRTARNADGTPLSETVNINSITYAQALEYDFGIWKGSEYAGTKIPTFEEFIVLCRNIGLDAYVELKTNSGNTKEMIAEMINLARSLNMLNNITWIGDSSTLLGWVCEYDETARIGLVVSTVNDSTLATLQSFKTGKNTVFLDCRYYTESQVNAITNAGFAVEVWTVDSVSDVLALNKRISGVTSNIVNASKIIYSNSI